ncbi:ribosome recycling factor [Hyphomicrobium sulfonivorans]|uniref:Ribosome-recycling factor n=1 Tax=Hyphomicrobium sulfonivorans TaxID=121290 RepID=A0A109BKK2_HYPSL|nr:ribosome recycling factor [Hyphomicrobium sulfonivorans]KWT70190.1 Ribosome recycling factor [Hyphomicrobium sulfonivorans]MBI1650741.1 ribosome recycling factor [Hyphomicrobium sulfonivorans]NSL71901.1 ribosome recycling factor [Hyphomicrobium sulfonivorans]
MSGNFDLNDLEKRMRGALDVLKRDFSGLRTGRASTHLLDPIQVTVYGAKMPLSQVATVSVPESRTISVQVWDRTNVSAVEKGIREANLGLNPIIDGTLLRLPIPPLTADRRNELAKLAHKYAESCRVAVRNVRREGMDLLKKLEKDGKISEDDQRKSSTKVQELTDRLIKDIDETLATKEVEIHKV